MARKTEKEFVGEGLSDADFAALNGDAVAAEDQATENVQAREPEQAVESTQPEPTSQEGAPEESQKVDLRALQEARAEKRQLEEKLARYKAEEAERAARLDERLKLISEALAKQNAPQKPEAPDPDTDPFGYMQHELQTANERIKAFEEEQRRATERQKADQERQLIIDRADMTLAKARGSNPDMDEALSFATEAVKQEIHRRLSMAGVQGQAYVQQFNDMFNATLTQYAAQCPDDPNEAAEHIRRHARYWGWAGPQVSAAAQPQPAPAPQVQQPSVQQRAEQQQRHMSLSGVTGSEPPKRLTAKDIADMPDKEWRDLMRTAAGRRQLEDQFGGV